MIEIWDLFEIDLDWSGVTEVGKEGLISADAEVFDRPSLRVINRQRTY